MWVTKSGVWECQFIFCELCLGNRGLKRRADWNTEGRQDAMGSLMWELGPVVKTSFCVGVLSFVTAPLKNRNELWKKHDLFFLITRVFRLCWNIFSCFGNILYSYNTCFVVQSCATKGNFTDSSEWNGLSGTQRMFADTYPITVMSQASIPSEHWQVIGVTSAGKWEVHK